VLKGRVSTQRTVILFLCYPFEINYGVISVQESGDKTRKLSSACHRRQQ